MGYNPEIEGMLFRNCFGFDHIVFWKRESRRVWREVKGDEAKTCVYGKPFPCAANCVAFGYFTKSAD